MTIPFRIVMYAAPMVVAVSNMQIGMTLILAY